MESYFSRVYKEHFRSLFLPPLRQPKLWPEPFSSKNSGHGGSQLNYSKTPLFFPPINTGSGLCFQSQNPTISFQNPQNSKSNPSGERPSSLRRTRFAEESHESMYSNPLLSVWTVLDGVEFLCLETSDPSLVIGEGTSINQNALASWLDLTGKNSTPKL